MSAAAAAVAAFCCSSASARAVPQRLAGRRQLGGRRLGVDLLTVGRGGAKLGQLGAQSRGVLTAAETFELRRLRGAALGERAAPGIQRTCGLDIGHPAAASS